MPIQCFIYVLSLFFLITNCYTDNLLKNHVVTKENDV